MRRNGHLDRRLLPPTQRQQTLLIAQAEERVERFSQRNRYTGQRCPGCGARFLADRGQTYCGQRCSGRWNARGKRPATPGMPDARLPVPSSTKADPHPPGTGHREPGIPSEGAADL